MDLDARSNDDERVHGHVEEDNPQQLEAFRGLFNETVFAAEAAAETRADFDDEDIEWVWGDLGS